MKLYWIKARLSHENLGSSTIERYVVARSLEAAKRAIADPYVEVEVLEMKIIQDLVIISPN